MPSVDFPSLSVLIVDDNRHMRTVIRTILEMLGVRRIREAGDGADALKIFGQFLPDLIICDRVMSPMDGVEFITHIRTGRDCPNPDVPILMLTAHTEVQRIVEARDAGVHDILAKPISAKSLAERITTLLSKPRLPSRPVSAAGGRPAFLPA